MASRNEPTVVEIDENGRRWAKGSSSTSEDTDCMEAARDPEVVHIRSSHNRRGRVIAVPVAGWCSFVDFAARRLH
ncbi:DUF397 domain-containing protein [Actinokineospora cianjurensis]|uniref:Uncharacterized protein DUF397 n=1 Tax=Actinokineospora cianjurensis TaxID=585224 RepID=A0A421B465_9PSEU|nr:uncharacterized protein DUF397 [Actinokineospora cianjurensis]